MKFERDNFAKILNYNVFLCLYQLGSENSKKCKRISQGLLKIWTEHSHWFLLNNKPFEITLQKSQYFYSSGRNEFSPNLEAVALKLNLPCPFDVLDTFGRKFKSKAPRALKFGTKRIPIEINNWWKFGVDISNHFWDIWNWRFFFFQVSPTWKEKVFENHI